MEKKISKPSPKKSSIFCVFTLDIHKYIEPCKSRFRTGRYHVRYSIFVFQDIRNLYKVLSRSCFRKIHYYTRNNNLFHRRHNIQIHKQNYIGPQCCRVCFRKVLQNILQDTRIRSLRLEQCKLHNDRDLDSHMAFSLWSSLSLLSSKLSLFRTTCSCCCCISCCFYLTRFYKIN